MISVNFLLVDDREENLLSLESLLRRNNLNLLKARSGREALELLLDHDVALALVDVQMPEMDGFELAEMMRGTQRTKHIPIIFVTASNADQVRRFRGYETGAVDFINKPIEASVLKSKANVFFDLYVQRQEVAHQRDKLAAASAENQRLLDETREYAHALQEADHRKDEFLATLSHELRNPLAPLRNGLEILQRTMDDAVREKIYCTMERELDHMVSLINDLLDISRVSKGKINLQKRPYTINEAVQMALESSEEIIRGREHEVLLHGADTAVWVDADPTRLIQIIANLIHNAAKYTPFGGRLEIVIAEQDGQATVRITDSGVGIPADKLAHIFELFTQLEASASESDGGLGIGLSLARKLVDLHGGEIRAESAGIGRGSTFTVSMPVISAPSAVPVSPEPSSRSGDQSLSVLVVDDNISAAETMAMMIEMAGHKVKLAQNGHEALQQARALLPDAILLDIGLPDISGHEVARTLRSDERFEGTLLVAQTGWGQQRDKDAAFAAGFDHHLVKPVKLDAILQLLDQRQTNALPAG